MAYGSEHSATAKFVGCSSRVLVLCVAAEVRTQLVAVVVVEESGASDNCSNLLFFDVPEPQSACDTTTTNGRTTIGHENEVI
jgi:hypothetical protein